MYQWYSIIKLTNVGETIEHFSLDIEIDIYVH